MRKIKTKFQNKLIDELTIPVKGLPYKLKDKESLVAIFKFYKFDLFDCVDMLANKQIIIEGKDFNTKLVAGYIGKDLFQMPLACIDLPDNLIGCIDEELRRNNDFGKYIVVDYNNLPMSFDGTQFAYVQYGLGALEIYSFFQAHVLIDKTIKYRNANFKNTLEKHDLEYFLIPLNYSKDFQTASKAELYKK